MAGTVTTVLITSERHSSAMKEGQAKEAINVGDIVEHKAGSYGSMLQFTKGGTLHNVRVALEFGTKELGDSWASGDKFPYYVGQPGDVLYVNAAATKAANGDIAVGEIMGGAAKTDGCLGPTPLSAGSVAMAMEAVGTPNTGTTVSQIKAEVL